jgi:Rieske 2Fe-2S family protein
VSYLRPQQLFGQLRDSVVNGEPQLGDTATFLDVEHYISQERFNEEQRLIFKRTPVVLGHQDMLPEANTCITHEALGVPLLLSRDADNKLHAFFNVCRHRQTKLVHDTEICSKARLTCPYHGWTYGLDGRLLGVPMAEGFPDLQKAEFGLKEIPITVEYGFIFASLNSNPVADTLPHLKELEAHFADLKIAEHRYFTHRYSEVAANWKVIYDAFTEAYHIHRLHRNSLAEFFLDNVASLQAMGKHFCAAVGRKGLLDVDQPPGDIENLKVLITFTYFIFPNSLLIISPDYVNMLTLYPRSPDSTLVLDTMLTRFPPEDEKAREHWQRSFDLLDGEVFGKEDYWISEQVQAGLRSGAASEFPVGRYEYGIRMFHDKLDQEMERQRGLAD